MASSGTIKSSVYRSHLWLTFNWSQSSQSIINNTTTISWNLKLHWDARISFSASKSYSVTVNGTTYSGSYTGGASGTSGSVTIKSGTTTISHNTDGSKSFSVSANFSIAITYSGSSLSSMSLSGTQTLNTIPRASSISFSASSLLPNASQTITISRASSSFTHTLTYSCNGITGTIASKTTSTSASFTVPASLITKSPNANQTMTVTCQTYNGTVLIGTKTATFTVGYYSPSIISAKTGTELGGTMSFTISRNSSLFTHSMWYSFGSKTWQAIGSSLGTSSSFIPDISLCSQIPNATSGSMTIILRTYYGSTQIGSDKYYYYEMSVPSSIVPSFDDVTCIEAVDDVYNLIGAYVQNKSKLSLGITNAVGNQGSSIKSYKITVANQTINAASGVTGIITINGLQTITASITDSRGRTTVKTKEIKILPYSHPKISGVGVDRNTDTTADIIANLSASSLKVEDTEKNKLFYKIEYKKKDDVTYSSVNGEYSSLEQVLSKTITSLDSTRSYEFNVYVGDVFGYSSIFEKLSVSTAFKAFDFDVKSGRLGIKKVLEHDESIIEVPEDSIVFVGENSLNLNHILVYIGEE